MRRMMVKILALLLVSSVGMHTLPADAQDIVLNEGSGDIFFLYESSANIWHTVFRAKGPTGQPTTTGATGLTNPWTPFTGALGTVVAAEAGDTGDYVYDNLTVNLATPHTMEFGDFTFNLSRAGGSSPSPLTPATPETTDLGIRFRLREDQVAMGTGSDNAFDQFENFTMTLNLASSTFSNGSGTINLNDPSAPAVALFNWDTFNDPVAMFNTATDDLTADFGGIWGHVHRNWGFSEYGDYSLVFGFNGVGGEYGGDAPTGSATLNFNVIPEPSTFGLVVLGLGFGGLMRKKRLQSIG